MPQVFDQDTLIPSKFSEMVEESLEMKFLSMDRKVLPDHYRYRLAKDIHYSRQPFGDIARKYYSHQGYATSPAISSFSGTNYLPPKELVVFDNHFEWTKESEEKVFSFPDIFLGTGDPVEVAKDFSTLCNEFESETSWLKAAGFCNPVPFRMVVDFPLGPPFWDSVARLSQLCMRFASSNWYKLAVYMISTNQRWVIGTREKPLSPISKFFKTGDVPGLLVEAYGVVCDVPPKVVATVASELFPLGKAGDFVPVCVMASCKPEALDDALSVAKSSSSILALEDKCEDIVSTYQTVIDWETFHGTRGHNYGCCGFCDLRDMFPENILSPKQAALLARRLNDEAFQELLTFTEGAIGPKPAILLRRYRSNKFFLDLADWAETIGISGLNEVERAKRMKTRNEIQFKQFKLEYYSGRLLPESESTIIGESVNALDDASSNGGGLLGFFDATVDGHEDLDEPKDSSTTPMIQENNPLVYRIDEDDHIREPETRFNEYITDVRIWARHVTIPKAGIG
jgi:hypothetical protein